MIDCLIFSKDRAAQLDLLLRSIGRHAPRLYSSLTVLYTGSSRHYLRGYQQCYAEHGDTVRFQLEQRFQRDVQEWIADAGQVVSFLVDDDVFIRDAPDFLHALQSDSTYALSLRGGDYDYPFSVDGNIYRRFDVMTLLTGLEFRDPTELEHHGHLHRDRLPFREVTPCLPPCLVGVPANRVSVRSGMPHMGVSVEQLNDRYLDGGRLELATTKVPVNSAHWPLDYRWVGEGAPVTA